MLGEWRLRFWGPATLSHREEDEQKKVLGECRLRFWALLLSLTVKKMRPPPPKKMMIKQISKSIGGRRLGHTVQPPLRVMLTQGAMLMFSVLF